MMTVDERWERDFVLALRVRDVSGVAIGAALEEVKGHCVETGESPADAFGPPLAYAKSLSFPESAQVRGMPSLRTTAYGLFALAGLWVFPDAAGALLRGARMEVTKGQVVSAVTLLVVVVLLAWVVSPLAQKPFVAALAVTAALFLVIGPGILWRTPAFEAGALVPTVLAGLALLVGAVGLVRRHTDDAADPLVDPVTGRAEQARRVPGLLLRFGPLMFIVVAVTLAVLDWRVPR